MSGPHVINLVARTLGGSEYPISVDDKLSVAELKEVIAAQASDFTASTMRLLKGMNALDDYDSLAAAGLVDGNTVHIVRKLQDTSLDDDDDSSGVVGAEVKSPNPNIVTVKVPKGQGPGSKLMINPPGRRTMMVRVPDGVFEGSEFRVQLPPDEHSSDVSSSSSSQPELMQVKCPPSARPGQEILVMVPGRGRMRVTVPRGVTPGGYFKFQLPRA